MSTKWSPFAPYFSHPNTTTVGFEGIELAAIQGLRQIMKAKDAKISVLEKRLGALEHLVASLAERT